MADQRAAHRVGFIGAGKMATALARGLIAAGFTTAENLVASDVLAEARQQFAGETGAETGESNGWVLRQAEVVILAVKPQQMGAVLAEIAPETTAEHLIVSVAAGVPLQRLTEALGAERRVVRVMPNTPSLIGAGAAGFARGGMASEADGRLVEEMLSTVGLAIELPEKLLDSVTGLSGSGPAYVFQIIEALSDGGVRMGLPRQTATRLAAQTLYGAARMVLETQQHPGVLKDGVTSPAGTTIAGLHALERGRLRATLMEAVEAATSRSQELGGVKH